MTKMCVCDFLTRSVSGSPSERVCFGETHIRPCWGDGHGNKIIRLMALEVDRWTQHLWAEDKRFALYESGERPKSVIF